MTEEKTQARYTKGDIVRVVDEPYKDCPFEWIGEMDDYCGQTATITSVTWNKWAKAWGYSIDIDEYCCTWCEDCFVPESDIEESDADISLLIP